MLKVSIIIPIFKVEEYLERCLISVFNQTYKNIEIILVDDASPDRSMEIAKEVVKKFETSHDIIILTHEKNRGLSAARNTGVEKATGDYIYFIDSDDSFSSPDSISILVEYAKETGADVTSANYQRVYPDRKSISIYNKLFFLNGEKVIDGYCNNLIPIVACNKLYKREIFKNIRFKEGILNEDELFLYKLIFRQYSFALTGEVTYDYYINPQSIMTTLNYNRLISPIIVYEEITKEYKQLDLHHDKLLINFDRFAFQRYVNTLTSNISWKEKRNLYKRLRNAQKNIAGKGKMRYIFHSHLFFPVPIAMGLLSIISKYYKKSRNL